MSLIKSPLDPHTPERSDLRRSEIPLTPREGSWSFGPPHPFYTIRSFRAYRIREATGSPTVSLISIRFAL
jgi:hypothetical protein